MKVRLCMLQFDSVPQGLDRSAVLATLVRATRAWEKAVPGLRLKWHPTWRIPQSGDILFKFGPVPSTPGQRNLAMSGSVAEADIITFSAAEQWHLAPKAGFFAQVGRWFARGKRDFLTVALHELGHAMGLAHTEDESDSVMHPHAESFGLWSEPSERDAARLAAKLAIWCLAGFLILGDFKGGLTNSGPLPPPAPERGLRNALQRLPAPVSRDQANKGGVRA